MNFRNSIRDVNEEVFNTLVHKALDYGPHNIRKIGIKGIIARLHDKLARLETLSEPGRTNSVPDESITDTWIDVCGYGVIALIVLRGEWPEERIPEDEETRPQNHTTSRTRQNSFSVYLGGPVDRSENPHEWRKEVSRLLGPKYTCFSPPAAFSHDVQLGENKFVRAVNESAISLCDIAIFYLPDNVLTIGTPIEIEMCRVLGKPMVVVTSQPAVYLDGIYVMGNLIDAVDFVLGKTGQ